MKKSKRWNYLPLNDAALKFLGKIQEGDGLVFKLYDEKTINKDLRKWCSAAEVTKSTVNKDGHLEPYPLHFHISRHTFACLHILAGTSIYDLKELMCHEHVATTERYARVMDRRKRKAANNLRDYTLPQLLAEEHEEAPI